MRQNVPFSFSKDCERAFFTLRDALVSLSVLAIYNETRETELHTDASSDTILVAQRRLSQDYIALNWKLWQLSRHLDVMDPLLEHANRLGL